MKKTSLVFLNATSGGCPEQLVDLLSILKGYFACLSSNVSSL